MFLVLATALAGSQVGWPCQRLNWGWRNVWSTCSIHSFAPASTPETAATIPTGFRFTNAASPANTMNAGGWYQPGSTAAIPAFFCSNAAATGTGTTSALRNRCRRAVDAYGALVRACQLPPATAGNRGPNALTPDFAPAGGHQPHVSNVQGLTHAAGFCVLPTGTPAHPAALPTPSTVCPGLLGWFTVVYNACGFTNGPALSPVTTPNGAPAAPLVHNYFPYGGTVNTAVLTAPDASPIAPGTRVGIFCGPGATAPQTWNGVGAAFRTSRCRKALDQFGRTAQRCHASTATTPAGPAQAGGYSDPLRILAVGSVPNGATASPLGINIWAPGCN